MHEIKDILKNIPKEDFVDGLVNLHIHTNYSDGLGDFKSICMQANEKYKIFAITDHNTVQGHIDNPDCGQIVGVEFDVWYKYIFLHLLAYGIDINADCMKGFYAKTKKETEKDIVRFFSTRNIKNLISAIHAAGGIAVLAHPCCCWALSMEDFIRDLVAIGLDGVEIYYPYPRWRKYIKFSNPDNIERIADKYGLIKTGGTDCHNENLF